MISLIRVHSTNPTQMVSLRCLTYQFISIAKQNEMISMVSTIRTIIISPFVKDPTHQHHKSVIDIKKGREPKLLYLSTLITLSDQTKQREIDNPLTTLYHKIISFSKIAQTKLAVTIINSKEEQNEN